MITEEFIYVGVSKNTFESNPVIRQFAGELVLKATSKRITKAKHHFTGFKEMPDMYGLPVTKVTLACNDEDQYCGRCGSYGCPGDC